MNIVIPAVALQTMIFGNPFVDYGFAAGYFIGFLLLFKILQSVILLRLKIMSERTHTDLDDTFISILQSIRPSFYIVLALYMAVRTLELPIWAAKALDAGLVIVLVAQSLIALQILLNFVVHKRTGPAGAGNAESAARFLSAIAKVALWTVGILFILSNIGVNITSLVAGLGIGGIAIALAAQNVLTDLFSSLSIYLDRPFHVGDFIVVGDLQGTVRRIGIKTTRIQSIDGEEIIISNRELTSGRIKNFSRMEERRVQLDITVAASISPKTLHTLPEIVAAAVREVPGARFGQAHLHTIAGSGYTFRVVFYTAARNFDSYIQARHEVNFHLVEALKKAKVDLA